MIEILVLPEGRRACRGGVQEERVFGVGDLGGGEEEGIGPDTVDGTFAILTGGGTHEEPGFGDGDETGLGEGRCAGLGVRMSGCHGPVWCSELNVIRKRGLTRDYCIAKNAMRRAARPGPSAGKKRLSG